MLKKHRGFLLGILIAVLTLIFTVPATGGVTFPDTPPGNRMKAYLEALNSQDKDVWKEYCSGDFWQKGNGPEEVEHRLGMFERLTLDLGGVEPVKIAENSATRITVTVHAVKPSGPMEWVNFTLETAPEEPYQIVGLTVRPSEKPSDGSPQRKLSDEEIVDSLKVYLAGLAAKDMFSGTVLLAKDDRVLFKEAYGTACKRYDVPNRTDTKFNLGSMNKMFTGVAVAQLAEQGKLSYDDPIIKYLPDYPNREAAEKVKIRHLLTHTSGMGSYWGELFAVNFWKIKTVQQLADLIMDKPLEFEPGERFSYSNSGPVILGLIIEKITGMSYYDYVNEYIYKPAGMINSGCFEVDRPVKNVAIGYARVDYDGRPSDDWYNNLFMHAVKGGPAGGGYSTVEDLFRFSRALREYKLLNEETTNLVVSGKEDMGPDMKYGYLFGDRNENGYRIVGHSGGAPGINANLDIYWEAGYTAAVMSNYDRAASEVSRELRILIAR